MTRDYYKLLTNKLIKDIEALIGCCKPLMVLDNKKLARDVSDQEWNYLK